MVRSRVIQSVGAAVMIALIAACGSDSGTSLDEEQNPAPTQSSTATVVDATEAPSEETSPATEPTTESSEVVTTDAVTSESGCGSDNFDLAVNDVVRADGLPSPELSVTCTSDSMIIESNNMITYEYVPMTPNGLEAQSLVYELPIQPTEASAPGAIGLGSIGVAANGVTLFGAFENPRDDYRDPLLDGLLDFCNGHTAQQGLYHYHARPDCIFADPTEPGTVVGYAYDGYEILVPTVCVDDACSDTTVVTSSYQKINGDDLGAFTGWEYAEGSGDLDECNGGNDANGEYHYYATDEFPYLPFCYHGVTDHSVGEFNDEPPQGGPA